MSSHHIVTENQEPAIIITDSEFDITVLEGLLEWGSKLIVVDSSLKKVVVDLGIKVDEVICRLQEVEKVKKLLEIQYPHYQLFVHEETTIEEIVCGYLNGQRNFSFNILTNNEGLITNTNVYSGLKQIVVYQKKYRGNYVLKGASFSKWFVKDSLLEVVSVGNREGKYHTSNLKSTTKGSFKVIENGVAEIKANNGDFLVKYTVA